MPATAYYISNFVSCKEEQITLQGVYNTGKARWTQLAARRLQNWGGIPHVKGMIAEDIPDWLTKHLIAIDNLNLMEGNRPNHVLINEYLPGQGIMPHKDGTLFHPTIATISLGSHTILKFLENCEVDGKISLKPIFSLLLEPRSLLVLRESLFNDYLHCIEELTEDSLTDVANINMCSDYTRDMTLKRDTRVSLTIRHVPKTTKFKINLGNK